jgi:uncharacterized Ntn-hydrolase superfamily protein
MGLRRGSLAVAGAVVALTAIAAAPAAATWSIVGVDQTTGEVGVAIASCVGFETALAPTLVPGKGAAVSQAGLNKESGAAIVKGLENGDSAEQVIAGLTQPSADEELPLRQYGVVTLPSGAATFTGAEVPAAAGAVKNAGQTASVQGAAVETDAVLTESLAAFEATSGDLGEKLVAALDAGNKAGGDADCVEDANAASLLIANKDELPYSQTKRLPDQFQAFVYAIYGRDFAQAPPQGNVPSTYISVVTGQGDNAVVRLSETYSKEKDSPGPIKQRIIAPSASGGDTTGFLARVGFVVLVVAAITVTVVVVLIVRRAAGKAHRPISEKDD